MVKYRMNILDRFVAFLSPVSGARRIAARARIEFIQEGRRSLAEIYNKRRTARITTAESPNRALEGVDNVRNELRQMYLSDSAAAGIIRRLKRGSVGQGLFLQVTINIQGMDKEEQGRLENEIERKFDKWARNPQACDIEERQTLYRKQGLVAKKFFEDGEVFVLIVSGRTRTGTDNKSGNSFSLQLLESDRVVSLTKPKADNGNPIVRGIEVDKETGAPVAIYVCPNYDRTMYKEAIRIPIYGEDGTKQVYHLYDQERPEQYRGYPILAPAVKDLQDLDRYQEAEITGATLAACFGAIIKTDRNVGVDEDLPVEENKDKTDYVKDLYPGFIQELGKDEDLKAFEYNRPNSQYGTTVMGLKAEISFVTGIPYSILFQDFAAVNFSSARYAGQDADKVHKENREFFVDGIWRDIFNLWLRDEIVAGRIILPRGVGIEDISPTFGGPKTICFDPNKEQQANEKGLAMNTMTLAEIAADGTWQDKVRQRAREIKAIIEEAKAAGVDPGLMLPAYAKTSKQDGEADKADQ